MSNNNLHIDGCVVMQETLSKQKAKKKIQSFMTCKEIDIFNKNLNKNKFKIIKYIKKKQTT